MKKDKFEYGYLAPLNYDRYFKKVFKDTKISKQFLEDFLDIKIDEIELLDRKNLITDDSKSVKFDFRCKIENKHIVIEMQQWYKPDIIQRFLLYHSLNISLQLEDLPTKNIKIKNKYKEIKDYRRLEPTITLIWLVDDTLGMSDNYTNYSMYPQVIADFIRNSELWETEKFEKIKEKRTELISILNNNTKELDFLQTNKLTFMFQKNIVKNSKFEKYKRWFEFAEKTKNFSNTANDFIDYDKDIIFSEMIKRLTTKFFDDEQIKNLKDTKEIWDGLKRWEEGVYKYGLIDGLKKGREKGREEGREEGKEEEKVNNAIKMLKRNLELNLIQDITGLSIKRIKELKKQLS